jgi:transposase
METKSYAERCQAIQLLRSGSTPKQVATVMGRHISWVYKWQARYAETGWAGLKDRSRARKQPPPRLPEQVKQRIREVRCELEAEAQQPGKLGYIGARAIRSRLRQQQRQPVPSISSIERELRAAGMVRPRQAAPPPQVNYPHLKPNRPHQLVQVDIVPHYLPGGGSVACFNAIDVVSRYPTGQPSAKKGARDAANFLLHVWHDLGIPDYTQLDNESCFSGGFTHAYVLGRVLRLGLWVGTQLVYSPFYHPESNGYVERFHQDYNRHVWQVCHLPDLAAVETHSPPFFTAYRHSQHHSALNEHSPADLHWAHASRRLPDNLVLPSRLPLTVGQVHFMRRVDENRAIRVLNVDWPVQPAHPDQGVWATLTLHPQRATLAVFDAAPGQSRHRRCLAWYPFPLHEPVLPLQDCFRQPSRRPAFLGQWLTRSLQQLSSMF